MDLTPFAEPVAELDLTECSPQVIVKARGMIRERGVIHDVDQPDVWWVRSGSRGGVLYRVQIGRSYAGDPVWATCTCNFGLNRLRSGRIGCSHAAAVFLAGGYGKEDAG